MDRSRTCKQTAIAAQVYGATHLYLPCHKSRNKKKHANILTQGFYYEKKSTGQLVCTISVFTETFITVYINFKENDVCYKKYMKNPSNIEKYLKNV